jgi:hypothetical protein
MFDIDPVNHFPSTRKPDFYLTRLLGSTFATLIVVMVLYVTIRHELITHLRLTVRTLGMAHFEACVMLAFWGDPDVITTFWNGHKAYAITRYSIAHAHLFVQCWQAMLWQIERGTIAAALLLFAPPLARALLHLAMDVWRGPPSHSVPGKLIVSQPVNDDWMKAEVPPPPLNRFEPLPIAVVESAPDVVPIAVEPAAPAEPDLPVVAVRKRVRKPPKPAAVSLADSPPGPPPVEPGQVRKRRKPEA